MNKLIMANFLLLITGCTASNDLCSFVFSNNSLTGLVKQNHAAVCYYENYTKRAGNDLSVCDEIRADYRGACYGAIAYYENDSSICQQLDGTNRTNLGDGSIISNVDECMIVFEARNLFNK